MSCVLIKKLSFCITKIYITFSSQKKQKKNLYNILRMLWSFDKLVVRRGINLHVNFTQQLSQWHGVVATNVGLEHIISCHPNNYCLLIKLAEGKLESIECSICLNSIIWSKSLILININFHDYVRFMQSHNKDCQRGISMMSKDKFRDKYYSTFCEDINFSSFSVPMNLTKNKRCIFSADIHVVKNKQ